MSDPLLAVESLGVCFDTPGGVVRAVEDVSLQLSAGETLGMIGESGCGKSTLMLALAGLLDRPAGRVTGGRAMWRGRDLLSLGERELRRLRGREIGLVFQDPHSALHPAIPVLDQVAEAFAAHHPVAATEARERAHRSLLDVGLPESALAHATYAHEWSGGMRQRALLAIALANDPALLIADEPTTALDVTVQAQIIELLRGSRTSRIDDGDGRRAILLITHDLGVIAELADRVAVMYAGRIVETGPVDVIFDAPSHPYTIGLLASRPGIGARAPRLGGRPPDPRHLPPGCAFHPRCPRSAGREACRLEVPRLQAGGASDGEHAAACHFAGETTAPSRHPRRPGVRAARSGPDARTDPALRAERLTTTYDRPGSGRPVRALEDVGLRIAYGEVLGLVGESGCGKSTLARTLLGLERPSSGRVELGGDVFLDAARGVRPCRRDRRRIQMVFQDPYASLNPRRTIGETLAQPLRIHGRFDEAGGWRRVHEMLERVGLTPADASCFPRQLSGGQRQRASIARALVVEPEVLVLDEPLTALDVAVQAQILDLLAELGSALDLSMLLIAHDLTVVRDVADRVAVMYLGRVVETGPAGAIFTAPSHPYTRALLSAVPASHPRERGFEGRIRVGGEVPDASNVPVGCAFHPRCPRVAERCRREVPELADGRCACFHPVGRELSGSAR